MFLLLAFTKGFRSSFIVYYFGSNPNLIKLPLNMIIVVVASVECFEHVI
jgi:hypothetical protein